MAKYKIERVSLVEPTHQVTEIETNEVVYEGSKSSCRDFELKNDEINVGPKYERKSEGAAFLFSMISVEGVILLSMFLVMIVFFFRLIGN